MKPNIVLITTIAGLFLLTVKTKIDTKQMRQDISEIKAVAVIDEEKESSRNLSSNTRGNVTYFYPKKADGDPRPQFKKLSSYKTAIESFSETYGLKILSIQPVGPNEIIDDEPAYMEVIVTHTP